MRLAEATGHVDVDLMLSQITPRQFAEWCAKDELEPIGMNGVCHILAKIGELIAAFVGSPARQRDFMPWLPEPREQSLSPSQSREAVLARLKQAAGGA